MRRTTLRTRVPIAIMAFALATHAIHAQPPTEEPTVPALVEGFILNKVVPAGWEAGEQLADGFDPHKGLYVSPGYGIDGPAYGTQPFDDARGSIEDALRDAEKTAVSTRRNRSSSGESASEFKWEFKNNREKELKVTELSIRLELLPAKRKQWVLPEHLLTGRNAKLEENAVIEIVSTRSRQTAEFAQQANAACVHAYLKRTKEEYERVAFFGVPAEIWSNIQVGRDARFKVLFHGTESYESATGPRTILAAYFVPDQMWDLLLKKHTPKIEPAPEPHCKPRTWTSADGQYKVEGYANSASSKSVKIIKADGKLVEVDLVKLSRDDVDWVKAYIAAQRPLELPPRAGGSDDGY